MPPIGPVGVDITDLRSHLLVRLHGVWDVNAVLAASKDIAVRIDATPHRRALIDLLAMTGDLSMEERYRLGLSLGPIYSHAQKIAAVQAVRPDNGYVAKAANLRGAALVVFSHREDALAWLLA